MCVQGVETIESSHFITPENIERLKQAKEANRVQVRFFLDFSHFDFFTTIPSPSASSYKVEHKDMIVFELY